MARLRFPREKPPPFTETRWLASWRGRLGVKFDAVAIELDAKGRFIRVEQIENAIDDELT